MGLNVAVAGVPESEYIGSGIAVCLLLLYFSGALCVCIIISVASGKDAPGA
jgi:hypothetical protein